MSKVKGRRICRRSKEGEVEGQRKKERLKVKGRRRG